MIRFSDLVIVCTVAALLLSAAGNSRAEDLPIHLSPKPGWYTPLDQHDFGKAGRWALIAKPALHGYYQPVRISLPSRGLVSYLTPENLDPVLTPAPSQVGMLVGHVYRFRISGMADYPGIVLYPTLEILSRMHPPAGQEEKFPIPVEITPEEIRAALAERMVTKVIYLEDPQSAFLGYDEQIDPETGLIDRNRQRGILTREAPPHSNLLDTAYQLGRPMAILRIGGRVPETFNSHDEMLRQPAPIRISSQYTTQKR